MALTVDQLMELLRFEQPDELVSISYWDYELERYVTVRAHFATGNPPVVHGEKGKKLSK